MDWIIYILSTIGIFLTFSVLLVFLPFCIISLVCLVKNQGIKGVTIVAGVLTACTLFGICTFTFHSLGARGGGIIFFVSLGAAIVYAGITVLGFAKLRVRDSE